MTLCRKALQCRWLPVCFWGVSGAYLCKLILMGYIFLLISSRIKQVIPCEKKHNRKCITQKHLMCCFVWSPWSVLHWTDLWHLRRFPLAASPTIPAGSAPLHWPRSVPMRWFLGRKRLGFPPAGQKVGAGLSRAVFPHASTSRLAANLSATASATPSPSILSVLTATDGSVLTINSGLKLDYNHNCLFCLLFLYKNWVIIYSHLI